MRFALAVVLALGSALAFAASTVGQQRAAARTSDQDARDGRFFLQLLRDPRWLVATAGGAAGYALQGAALGIGSVLLVAPILVTSLLFALPLNARLAGERLPPGVLRSGLLLTVSLSVFEVLGSTGNGVSRGSLSGWLVVAVVGAPVVGGCVVLARLRSGSARAGLLAVAVGLLGGVLAVLTKSVVNAAGEGIWQLLSTGDIYALVLVGGAGIYLQQLSFQAGALRTSLPIMTVLEPIVAALLGVTLLHEQVHPGALRMSALILATLIATLATIALARVQAAGASAGPDGVRSTDSASHVCGVESAERTTVAVAAAARMATRKGHSLGE